MPETTRDRHKNTVPLNARVPSDYLTFLDKYYQEQGLENRSQGLVKILEGYRLLGLQTSEESAPETCKTPDGKTCPKFGGITKEAILCMTKRSQMDTLRYQFLPFLVAKVCNGKPFNTPVDKWTRQQFEYEISLLTTKEGSLSDRLKRAEEQLDASEGMKEKWKKEHAENQTLRTELKNTKEPIENLLQQTINLENDNDFKKGRIKELEAIVEAQSPDTLVQTNGELLDELEEIKQTMKIQESNHSANIEDLNLEIKKWEALAKTEKDKNIDIRFTVENVLRDFKQFLPTGSPSCQVCSEGGFKLKQDRQSALKAIENLEGYLQTVAR